MSVGWLTERIDVSAGGGWNWGFDVYVKSPGSFETPGNLSGCGLEGNLTQAGQATPTVINLTPFLSIAGSSDETVLISAPTSETEGWAFGDYDLALQVIDPSGNFSRYTVLSDPASGRVRVVV